MAVYRLEAKIIGRSGGKSATAAAAYRAAERIDDRRTGLSFDYTRKRGVLHSEILTPPGTPDWMRNRAELWNGVEAAEHRRDSQLARDLILSLPHELIHEQRVELVREFLMTTFVAHGMIADYSVHAPERQGDQRNHHAHVMLTMREFAGAGFGAKVREWNATERLEAWRERWADAVNRHLERHGHEARVDHRSLADQGLDREPEPKQGPVATEMEREGRPSNAGDDRRAVKARNADRDALAAERRAIEGELIYLDAKRGVWTRERPQGDPPRECFEGPEKKPSKRGPKRPLRATPDGGMVAQQREAMRRFERNSKWLERTRKSPTASGQKRKSPPPSQPEIREPEPMASKDDPARTVKDTATRPDHAQLRRQQAREVAQDNDRPAPLAHTQPVQPQEQGKPPELIKPKVWPMEQTMSAQNAGANQRFKESSAKAPANDPARNPTTTRDEGRAAGPQGGTRPEIGKAPERGLKFFGERDGGDRSAGKAGPEKAAQTPERGTSQAERGLSFYKDRHSEGRDLGSLKREQSKADAAKTEPSKAGAEKADKGGHRLNINRGPGQDHDR